MRNRDDDEIMRLARDAPQARELRIYWCADPVGCGRPHVILLDEDQRPIATFVAPAGWPKKLLDIDETGPK